MVGAIAELLEPVMSEPDGLNQETPQAFLVGYSYEDDVCYHPQQVHHVVILLRHAVCAVGGQDGAGAVEFVHTEAAVGRDAQNDPQKCAVEDETLIEKDLSTSSQRRRKELLARMTSL